MQLGKLLGMGATADVYEAGEGKAIKLFHEGFPKEIVDKEARNAKLLRGMGLRLAESYGVVSIDGRYGIMLQAIYGPSLLDIALETKESASLAVEMARIHKTFLEKTLPGAESMKDILARNIRATAYLSNEDKRRFLDILSGLPEGDGLCHGDMHFGNILFADGEYTVIDYNNICRGHRLFDITRTVYLTQLTPVPDDMPDRELFLRLKHQAADAYLVEMGVEREELSRYMAVTMAARLIETGANTSGERDHLLQLLENL